MLLPASFRGAFFAVTNSDSSRGRRLAVHQYPGRDEPWPEDMGRAPRRFRLRGFILDGDIRLGHTPVSLQRTALVKALEQKGAGTLTHPTLGVLSVVVERFNVGEELDAERRSAVEVEFLEAGQQSFPSGIVSSSGIAAATKLLDVATKVEGAVAIGAAFLSGSSRSDALTSALTWTSQIGALGVDATALHRLAALLPGSFGRFAAGGNSGLNGRNASPYAASVSIADLIPIASQQRVAITNAAAVLLAAVDQAVLSDAPEIPETAGALVSALAASCVDPADTMRLMMQVLRFSPSGVSNGMSKALTTIVHRAAASELTRAVAMYQPRSADDAASRIAELAPALDDLATIAADSGEDQSYAALRRCRGAIVTDLRSSGATLEQVRTFTFGQPLPSLALAQTIYGDADRADQLLAQVDVPNPLFLPSSFSALAA